MKTFLLSSFTDAIDVMRKWFNVNIGDVGITIAVCILAVCALLLFWNLCKAAIGKTKIVIKWGQLILLIIVICVLVYLCLMY